MLVFTQRNKVFRHLLVVLEPRTLSPHGYFLNLGINHANEKWGHVRPMSIQYPVLSWQDPNRADLWHQGHRRLLYVYGNADLCVFTATLTCTCLGRNSGHASQYPTIAFRVRTLTTWTCNIRVIAGYCTPNWWAGCTSPVTVALGWAGCTSPAIWKVYMANRLHLTHTKTATRHVKGYS